ncbi:MAG: diguanylate cyclase [Steroidobacteraceae bacterium]|nr:diguanylate cyclase [Steroidobacteraceae bacterium]
MPRNVLLIVADAAFAKSLRAMLPGFRDGEYSLECVQRCAEGVGRLAGPRGGDVAAVVADLSLPDSEGIGTYSRLASAAPHAPILLIGRTRDEYTLRQAMRLGAQDYLLKGHLDGRSLAKSLNNMLERADISDVLHLATERAETTLSSIGDAVVSTDIAGNITYLNPVAETMTGWSLQEACGRPLGEVLRIIDADTRIPVPDPLAMAMSRDETVGIGPNCVLLRRDGHETAIEDTAAPIHDANGAMSGAVIVFHDVTAARVMALRMSHLAQHDPLTGLPNRLLLEDRLSCAIESSRRRGTRLAVLFADVDRFKFYNDTFGHAAGDQILQSIACRLTACVRSADTVSRQGGDEFVVLLPDVESAEGACLIAAKILVAMRAPHRVDHQDLEVTVSVGISIYPDDGTDAGTLLRRADVALLRAKLQGRGDYRSFEPQSGIGSVDELPWHTRIRSRLAQDLESKPRPSRRQTQVGGSRPRSVPPFSRPA